MHEKVCRSSGTYYKICVGHFLKSLKMAAWQWHHQSGCHPVHSLCCLHAAALVVLLQPILSQEQGQLCRPATWYSTSGKAAVAMHQDQLIQCRPAIHHHVPRRTTHTMPLDQPACHTSHCHPIPTIVSSGAVTSLVTSLVSIQWHHCCLGQELLRYLNVCWKLGRLCKNPVDLHGFLFFLPNASL